jgi:ADP-ribose pyrophosphatase YjhB (NUDIX family)
MSSKTVAKIFVECGEYYVFSKKRKANAPESDNRLELLGGKVDEGEEPMQALLRELREEEQSGIIAAKVLQLQPQYKKVVVSGQNHYIYRVVLELYDLQNIRHDEKESRGFLKVGMDVLHNKHELLENLSRFTPKTRKIFRALDLI